MLKNTGVDQNPFVFRTFTRRSETFGSEFGGEEGTNTRRLSLRNNYLEAVGAIDLH